MLWFLFIILFLEFPSQKGTCPARMVSDFVGTSEHRAFGTDAAEVHHIFNQVARVSDNLSVNPESPRYCHPTAFPIYVSNVGRVESGKQNRHSIIPLLKPLSAMNDGGHGDLVGGIVVAEAAPAPGVNLAIEADFWKSLFEPVRCVNQAAFAGPEVFTIPSGSTAVEFFRSPPADERALAFEVNRQRHVGFVNHGLFRFGKIGYSFEFLSPTAGRGDWLGGFANYKKKPVDPEGFTQRNEHLFLEQEFSLSSRGTVKATIIAQILWGRKINRQTFEYQSHSGTLPDPNLIVNVFFKESLA
jgi:hypothetical protein